MSKRQNEKPRKPRRRRPEDVDVALVVVLHLVRIFVALALLGLGFYVALGPSVGYTPTQRIVLLLLVSLIPTLLLAAEVKSVYFEIKTPALVLGATGVGAFFFVTLHYIVQQTKPEEQIAVFYVVDEEGADVSLEPEYALMVSTTARGLAVRRFVDANTMILIFPEQVPSVEIAVRKLPHGPAYRGEVSYAGVRTSRLQLGTHLVAPEH